MLQRRHHVVLLGDSIFANAAYTSGGPDVATHLRQLAADWDVTLLAEDGATIRGVPAQLARLPADATHLVISVGGNDALQNGDLLAFTASSSVEVLQAFAARLAVFERAYRTVIAEAASAGRPVVVCTVYNGALDAARAVAARVGLAVFNDAILRAAIDLRLDTLELRSICTEPSDYANPIEPSVQGGRKIAHAIALAVGAIETPARPARIWGSPSAAGDVAARAGAAACRS